MDGALSWSWLHICQLSWVSMGVGAGSTAGISWTVVPMAPTFEPGIVFAQCPSMSDVGLGDKLLQSSLAHVCA